MKTASASVESDDFRDKAEARDSDPLREALDQEVAVQSQQRRKVQAYPGKVLSQRFGGELDERGESKSDLRKEAPSLALAPKPVPAGRAAPMAAQAKKSAAFEEISPPKRSRLDEYQKLT